MGGHFSPMILHSVCLILCLKWHDTCPACSPRLWPCCMPHDLPPHFWTTLIKPTPDTWPKGSNKQSDLIEEDGLGLLGLWKAKEETDVSSWFWRHGGTHKVFQGVAPRSRTKEILLACPELLGSYHSRPGCMFLDRWQLSSSVYVCPQHRHLPSPAMPLANLNGPCAFFENLSRANCIGQLGCFLRRFSLLAFLTFYPSRIPGLNPVDWHEHLFKCGTVLCSLRWV